MSEIQEKPQKVFFLARLQKQLITILSILFVLTLVVNLWLLADLGTRGSELSEIRNEQEEQKILNDLNRSELESLKVSSEIERKAREQLKLSEKEVTVVDLTTDVSAQE